MAHRQGAVSLAAGCSLYKEHTPCEDGAISQLAVSPDSTTAALACGDNAVRLMTVEGGAVELVTDKSSVTLNGIAFGVEAAPHLLAW